MAIHYRYYSPGQRKTDGWLALVAGANEFIISAASAIAIPTHRFLSQGSGGYGCMGENFPSLSLLPLLLLYILLLLLPLAPACLALFSALWYLHLHTASFFSDPFPSVCLSPFLNRYVLFFWGKSSSILFVALSLEIHLYRSIPAK